jgi:hypothetical protein
MLSVDEPRHRMDPRHLERSLRVERREDPRQPAREHRLSRARRPAEQDVVPTRGGELERAAGAFLPANVREVGRRRRAVAVRRKRRLRLQLELSSQVGRRLGEMVDRDRVDAGKSRLARGVPWAQETLDSEPARTFGDGENAAHPAQATVERQLADGSGAFERGPRQLLGRCEKCQRNRQVKAGSLLAQLGRREVHGDAAVREAQLGRGDPASDPLTRLLAGAVGETDDREAGQAVADVGFDVDAPRLESDERMRDRACKHASRLGRNP